MSCDRIRGYCSSVKVALSSGRLSGFGGLYRVSVYLRQRKMPVGEAQVVSRSATGLPRPWSKRRHNAAIRSRRSQPASQNDQPRRHSTLARPDRHSGVRMAIDSRRMIKPSRRGSIPAAAPRHIERARMSSPLAAVRLSIASDGSSSTVDPSVDTSSRLRRHVSWMASA
jgi:hypothetical protein